MQTGRRKLVCAGRKKELYWLKCGDLRERYIDKGMSMKAIGEEYGIGADLVRRRLQECGIEKRAGRDYSWIKCADLRNMYLGDKMSVTAITESLEVPTHVISRRLDECGIDKRSLSEAMTLVKKRHQIDPALLKRLYEDMGMSTTQIGRSLGVEQSVVVRRMQEYGIKAQPVGSVKGERRTYKQCRSIDGDLMVYMPEHERSSTQGYVKLRILAYEAYHNELPPKGDRIHIIDGNVDNLSRGNLRAMTNSEHSKFHCYANYKATGHAFKPCPKKDLAKYLAEWDQLKEEHDEFAV